jgi:dTDP-4-amino-4,6-dideoxygalactose transaminase
LNTDFLPFTRPSIDEATIAGVADVLRSGWITTGPMVRKFEEALGGCVDGRLVRSFNSGTAALEIGLRVAGVGPGDEVITTPLSWVATSNVILEVGAKPVFVDIDPVTRNIDLNLIEAAITPATRALMPVYLAGLPVDMDRLYAIAKKHNLRVIEDAAQALGSRWKGKRIGAIGDLVAFSFQANKNLTCAEGGALVINSDAEALLCEKYRLQGVTRQPDGEMECDVLGGKSNLTDIAARIALGQIPLIETVIERRKALAQRYFEQWDRSLGCEMPPADFENSNWHMFQVVLHERMKRPLFITRMREAGIGIGVHYPPIHLFALYRKLGFHEGQFPHAERIGRQIASLPLFPAMADTDVDRVCDAAKKVLS